MNNNVYIYIISIMLKINKSNSFGEHQYIESDNGTISFASLKEDKIWTIQNPSQKCINYFKFNMPTIVLREYCKINHILSLPASNIIKEENTKRKPDRKSI